MHIIVLLVVMLYLASTMHMSQVASDTPMVNFDGVADNDVKAANTLFDGGCFWCFCFCGGVSVISLLDFSW